MDLSRVAAAALLVVLASGGAGAQPLAPSAPLLGEGPLTTLLQPQKLDRSRPLLRPDTEGAGAAGSANRTAPCTRQGRAAPSVFGGGSGPGDYGRYLPAAPSAVARPNTAPAGGALAGAAPSARPPGVDRPLYGGTDRPLWNTGDGRPGAAAKPAQTSDADKAAGAAPASAAPPRDRPLWADGSLMASADPAASAGIPPAPCIDPPTPR